MLPKTGRGPGRRSGTEAFAAGLTSAALAEAEPGAGRAAAAAGRRARDFGAALGIAFGGGAGAAFFFFGSGFLPAMDVRYGSRGEEESQGQPDAAGDLARSPVMEELERLREDGRFL